LFLPHSGQKPNMRLRLLTATVTTAALAAVVPATAEAARYSGETKQGRATSVITGADGLVQRVVIRWRAPCRRGTYRNRSVFVPPLDASTPDAFNDAWVQRQRNRGGILGRVSVQLSGAHSASPDRWAGTLKVTVKVTRRGRVIDRCRLKNLTWSADLR
jgi:hypothetical protein